MAVAALYPCDQNFYRAFVLSVKDLTTVKMTTVIKLWDTSQGEDVNIGDLLMRNDELSYGSENLDDPSYTEKAIASLSIPALKVDSESLSKSSSSSLGLEEDSSQQKGAGTQNLSAHEEGASGQAKNLDAQCNINSTPSHIRQSEESLPQTRSAASTSDHSLHDFSQIGNFFNNCILTKLSTTGNSRFTQYMCSKRHRVYQNSCKTNM
ncbi:hypothetical protein E2C01_065815 [Portunus trituberculatus]|uniref:Uncharacterized protein n=1 Tax=Portunus trituberculatus TaxID=210409 RepID=A0A5B7HQN2_PORTR|nr:hypothetical protein [Portunus trituberculatus]